MADTGMGSFWTHNDDAVEITETDIQQEHIDTSNIVQTEYRHPTGTLRSCQCADVKKAYPSARPSSALSTQTDQLLPSLGSQ